MPKKRTIIKCAYILILLFSLLMPKRNYGEAVTVAAEGYIKWVDFNATSEIMSAALKSDLESYEAAKLGEGCHAEFSEIIALAAVKYGGELSRCKTSDIKDIAGRLSSGESGEEIAAGSKYYSYFKEAYGAVLDGFVGKYAVIEDGIIKTRYGLKVFSPIAAGYNYADFDDYGASRSYGYRRPHLGHDLMGSVGTPIVAVESGYVEACGWNQYGGWRIGIRSYDGRRYYYYAHLRRGHPYNDIYEGKQVTAGEVIGYLGMTGYSQKEDTNNIDAPHLHYGLQLIFDSSQKDGTNQIWIDLYEFTKFLSKHRSEVRLHKESGEFYPVNPIIDLEIPD